MSALVAHFYCSLTLSFKIKNHDETLHLLEWLNPKRQEITKVVKDVKKKELLYIAGENVIGVATVENSGDSSKILYNYHIMQ